jgi:hypothetical protein
MVPLASLWLPILLSAVLVFIASSVIHMALTYHRTDYGKVPSEEQAMDALRKFNIPPGDYFMPRPSGPAEMKSPEYKKKVELGPLIVMTVMPPGGFPMGKRLAQWFLYTLVVGVFAGYVAGRALPPHAPYLTVFRFTGTVAFAGYALALWQDSIWYSRKWSTTFKSTFDSLVYALLTAGTFGWLWPA